MTTGHGAVLSDDGRYRYKLWREWGTKPERLIVVGLNPSTADADADDPTIRRRVDFAKREGMSGLVMLNVFALRSTDPKKLYDVEDPIGPKNDFWLRTYIGQPVGKVVFAWGAHGASFRHSTYEVAHMAPRAYCWGVTRQGHPRHPLYLPAHTPLTLFRRSSMRYS